MSYVNCNACHILLHTRATTAVVVAACVCEWVNDDVYKFLINERKKTALSKKAKRKFVRTIGSFDTNRISGGVYHSELNGMRLNGRCRIYIVSRMKNGSSKQWFHWKKKTHTQRSHTKHRARMHSISHTRTQPHHRHTDEARTHIFSVGRTTRYVAIHKRAFVYVTQAETKKL